MEAGSSIHSSSSGGVDVGTSSSDINVHFNINKSNKGNDNKEVDIWRDTPVRLLGYANEVGESFRALVHLNVVRASYDLAFGYCFADTADKTNKIAQNEDVKKSEVIRTAVDTLLWQTLASVAIPGFTINRICAVSLFLLKRTPLPLTVQKYTTTAIGLGSIGFIYKPIDNFVDRLMDATVRQMFPPNSP